MLQELNRESRLLLYLTDELSPSDRAQMQKMLDTDADLRAELSQLDVSIQSFEDGMARLDASPLSSESAAVRQIGQLMRGRMSEQLARSTPAPLTKPKLRYPWWAYPSAAAAVVAIAFLGWWGNRPDSPIKTDSNRIAIVQSNPAASTEEANQFEDIKANFGRINLAQPEKSVASLDMAEDQIAELSRSQSQTFGFSNDGNE